MSMERGVARRQIADQVRRRRDGVFLLADVGAVLLVALLWAVLPFESSTEARWLGVVVLLGLAVFDLTLRRRLPIGVSNIAMIVARLAVSLTLCLLVAAMWYACVVFTVGLVTAAIPSEPRHRIAGLTVTSVAGLALLALRHEIDEAFLPLTIFVIGIAAADAWYRVWDMERIEVERRHGELVDRTRMFSWEIDRNSGEVVGLAGNVEEVIGWGVDEIVGTAIRDRVWAETRQPIEPKNDDGERTSIVRIRHRDGSEVVVRELSRVDHERGLVVGVSTDITELTHATDALRHQAEHDALTGLANRKKLEDTVTALLQPSSLVALLLADLDRFKEINDTLGHPTGDRFLTALGARFTEQLDDVDLVARFGGDEFAFVIAGDGVDSQTIESIAGRITRLASMPVEVDGVSLSVGASVGIAIAPEDGVTFSDLLKGADIAAYQAKRAGGGTVQRFESTPTELSLERLSLIGQVSAALERGELRLDFQPKVDVYTGAIVGAEALVRWYHPEHGLLLPASFLDALKVGGVRPLFTAMVLEEAAAFIAASEATGHPLPVAINLGTQACVDRELPGVIERTLDRHGVSPQRLTIEVSETIAINDRGGPGPVLEAAARLGVKLSIDDFGTGYAHFGRLQHRVFNEVKVDRHLIAGLGANAADGIIVRGVVDLATLLGLTVVAEGVETQSQLDRLRRFGCSIAQGFLFDAALPGPALLELLAAEHHYDTGDVANSAGAVLLQATAIDGLLASRASSPVAVAFDTLFSEVKDRFGGDVGVVIRDRADRLVAANPLVVSFFGPTLFERLIGTRDDAFEADTRGERFELEGVEVTAMPAHDGVVNHVDFRRGRGPVHKIAIDRKALHDLDGRLVGTVELLNPRRH